MSTVPISALKPGMKLAKDVRLNDNRLLLLSGFVMKTLYIESLHAFGIESVEIDDSTIGFVEYVSLEKLYFEAFDSIKSIMDSVREGEEINVQQTSQTVDSIVSKVMDNDMVMLQISGIKDIDNYTYLHSLNVCIYSILTGKNMGMSTDELISLGMGGFLHDMGKCRIPLEILQKPGALTDDEFYIMKLHTYYGNEIILNTHGLDKRTAVTALQHHEKFNGTGYPHKLKGDDIDLHSKIVCIADVYDALTSDRVYKKKSMPHVTIEYISQNAGSLFDPGIVETFISTIDIYPDNQVVILNTGEVGSIINTGSGVNEKPEIYVISSKYGPPVLNPYVVDLKDNPSSEIIDMLK